MPEPIDVQGFAGPHPTCREFVAQLAVWGFTQRREEDVHTVFRGPRGGTLRVLRSGLGRADPATAAKAARLAGVTIGEFWAGPQAAAVPAQELPAPMGAAARHPAERDTAIAIVLSIHAAADRPLGFDEVAGMSGGRVTRAQASAASAALCRGGQLDRIRSGVYQWSGGQRAATGQVPAPRQDHASAPAPQAGVPAAELLGQLFPPGIPMTTEMLADLEQWARLTGRLAAHGRAAS